MKVSPDENRLIPAGVTAAFMIFIFVSQLYAVADAQNWVPDGTWYNAKAVQLDQASSELSAAQVCGQNSQDPTPQCVIDHLKKAASFISDSVVQSEALAGVKSDIEIFAKNIQDDKTPLNYKRSILIHHTSPWFISIDQVRRNFRERAKAPGVNSKLLTVGRSAPANGGAANEQTTSPAQNPSNNR